MKRRVSIACPICGTVAEHAPWHVKNRNAQFCSRPCARQGQAKAKLQRFWQRAARMPNGCLEWQDGLSNGYGRASLNGRLQGAHCVAWQLTNGPIPDGLCVCHRCDNPSCVDPAHLFLGTAKDNVQDMVQKVRGRFGGHPMLAARLSEKVKAELKAAVPRDKQRSITAIARREGLPFASLYRWVKTGGKRWSE